MRTMAHRRNLHDEDTESDENEDYCNEEEKLSPPLQWKQERSRMQLHIHVYNYLSPLSIFMLYFTPVSDLLVTETNRYYHQFLDRHDRKQTLF